ncbi:hypothetical protein [Sinorhizobium sp. Sb3]|nr:hypothetical protein [Sinorhizobium sp. Sb3]
MPRSRVVFHYLAMSGVQVTTAWRGSGRYAEDSAGFSNHRPPPRPP